MIEIKNTNPNDEIILSDTRWAPDELKAITRDMQVKFAADNEILDAISANSIQVYLSGNLIAGTNQQYEVLRGLYSPAITDESGRQMVRVAITESGWSYLAQFIEVETSVLDSIHSYAETGVRETQHIAKYFDASGNELTTQTQIDTDCVKSVFTIKVGFDFEIIGGEMHQFETPTTDVRIHALIGMFDNNGSPISYKAFVKNLNMRYQTASKPNPTDGRAPKLLRKDFFPAPYDANQLQMICFHSPGTKHKMQVELEYYRP